MMSPKQQILFLTIIRRENIFILKFVFPNFSFPFFFLSPTMFSKPRFQQVSNFFPKSILFSFLGLPGVSKCVQSVLVKLNPTQL